MAQRIASLLPSTTEMACLLGLRERLVGISHECDFPESVRGLPVLTAAKVDAKARSAEIDRQVREVVANGLSVYRIDEEKLRELHPDLILTQDACAVCAVSFGEVQAAARKLLGAAADIVSLSPLHLEDVLQDILRVARAAGVAERGVEAVAGLRERLDELRARTARVPRPRVLALEWMDPPMPAGHWTPELLRIQGHAEPARDALADLSTRGDAGGARRSRLRRRRKRLLQPAGSAPGGERRDRPLRHPSRARGGPLVVA